MVHFPAHQRVQGLILEECRAVDEYLYERCLGQLTGARQRAGITQTDLAARLGRPQSFVAKYEERERRLDVAEYLMIARELGADPYQLLRAAKAIR